MRRILIGVGAAVVVIAGAAFAGVQWLQYRVEREVAATFAAMRPALGLATYGQPQFSPWTRTVRIKDVALEGDRNGLSPTKIGELALVGVPLFPSERITARRVDLTRTEITVAATRTIRIDAVAIDDLDVSRSIDWQLLRALAEAGSGPPVRRPQAKDVLPVVAETLEGIRFGRLEMLGLAFREGASGIDVASVRFDGAADGRLAELAVRGVMSVALPDKVSFGRVAVRKFDLAGLLRKSARLAAADRSPAPEEIAGLLSAVEGVDMDDVVIPDRRPNRVPGGIIHLVSVQLSWGQFVGTLPTVARYAVKAEMPIANEDGEPFQALRESGRTSVMVSFDIGSAWTERTRTFVLGPATFELDGLFSSSLTLSLGNFSPDLLVNDPAKMALAASALEVGPIELTLRDTGGLDFAASQVAKAQGIDLRAARSKMADGINQGARMQPRQSPEFQRLVDELGRFLAGDGPTMKVRLAPKGRVNLMQTLELIKLDPISALAQFSVEASVGGQ